MAKVIGNGLTATLGTSSFAVTSISMDSAERPVIDITAASNSSRIGVPGLRGVSTGSFTGILQDGEISDLEDELETCAYVTLMISAKQADCSTTETLMSASVHVTGFTIDGSIDEAVTVTVNFMLANGGDFI